MCSGGLKPKRLFRKKPTKKHFLEKSLPKSAIKIKMFYRKNSQKPKDYTI